jgi:hypothetical protein
VKRNLLLALAMILTVTGLVVPAGCSSPKITSESGAVILDQLYNLQPNSEFTTGVTGTIEDYGLKVTLFQGDDITVDRYRQLPESGYKVVIFRAHSGLLGSTGKAIYKTCIFTNEPYSGTAHVTEQLSDRLAKARVDENNPWVFGIGDSFVSSSMNGKFDGAVIIMMGCSGLYIEDIAKSFIEKGASAYIGWDATVGLDYVDKVTAGLIQELCADKLSLDEVISRVIQENGADPDFGATLKYYPPESGKNTFSELIK